MASTPRKTTATVIPALRYRDAPAAIHGCCDLEGHLWWFASYDPWTGSA